MFESSPLHRSRRGTCYPAYGLHTGLKTGGRAPYCTLGSGWRGTGVTINKPESVSKLPYRSMLTRRDLHGARTVLHFAYHSGIVPLHAGRQLPSQPLMDRRSKVQATSAVVHPRRSTIHGQVLSATISRGGCLPHVVLPSKRKASVMPLPRLGDLLVRHILLQRRRRETQCFEGFLAPRGLPARSPVQMKTDPVPQNSIRSPISWRPAAVSSLPIRLMQSRLHRKQVLRRVAQCPRRQ